VRWQAAPRSVEELRDLEATDLGAAREGHTNKFVLESAMHSMRTSPALGDAKVGALLLSATRDHAPRSLHTFADLAASMVSAAEARYGVSSTEAAAVRQAYDGIGLDASLRASGSGVLRPTSAEELFAGLDEEQAALRFPWKVAAPAAALVGGAGGVALARSRN
jgi:hypothetical protein